MRAGAAEDRLAANVSAADPFRRPGKRNPVEGKRRLQRQRAVRTLRLRVAGQSPAVQPEPTQHRPIPRPGRRHGDIDRPRLLAAETHRVGAKRDLALDDAEKARIERLRGQPARRRRGGGFRRSRERRRSGRRSGQRQITVEVDTPRLDRQAHFRNRARDIDTPRRAGLDALAGQRRFRHLDGAAFSMREARREAQLTGIGCAFGQRTPGPRQEFCDGSRFQNRLAVESDRLHPRRPLVARRRRAGFERRLESERRAGKNRIESSEGGGKRDRSAAQRQASRHAHRPVGRGRDGVDGDIGRGEGLPPRGVANAQGAAFDAERPERNLHAPLLLPAGARLPRRRGGLFLPFFPGSGSAASVDRYARVGNRDPGNREFPAQQRPRVEREGNGADPRRLVGQPHIVDDERKRGQRN